MALSLLAAPPPQFLGFGTGSSSSSTSPSWRSNGVLFCLDRLSRCWKKTSFSCSSLLIFWIVSWFVSPCHSTTTYLPWGGHSNCLPCVPKRPPYRWRPTGGLFHTLPSQVASQVASSSAFSLPLRGAMVCSCLFQALHVMKCVCFMRKPAKSLPNLQLQEFPVPNKPLVILFVATSWLRQFWGEFHQISFWNLLVNWTPYRTPGQSPSTKGLDPHVGS